MKFKFLGSGMNLSEFMKEIRSKTNLPYPLEKDIVEAVLTTKRTVFSLANYVEVFDANPSGMIQVNTVWKFMGGFVLVQSRWQPAIETGTPVALTSQQESLRTRVISAMPSNIICSVDTDGLKRQYLLDCLEKMLNLYKDEDG